jgi:GT2 family glycosyltransferase
MRLAIAVCNYNRRELALQCIEAALISAGSDSRAFVADNASTDGSAKAIEDRFGDRVCVYRELNNLGSSGGFHRAVQMALDAEPENILLLDSDCIISPTTVPCLLDFAMAHPEFSVVGPNIYWPEPDDLVQEFGGTIDWDAALCRGEFRNYDEKNNPKIEGWRETDYIAACCLLVRSSAILQHGNIDPGHFLYFDDVEWQWRMRLGGRRIAVTSDARAVHYCGAANRRSCLPTYYLWRNRLHFFRKYAAANVREQTINRIIDDTAQAVATCRLLGYQNAATAIFDGISDALRGNWGIKDFSGIDLRCDSPAPLLPDGWEIMPVLKVPHIFASAPEGEKDNRHLILEDPFGKRITAAQAWTLSEKFKIESAGIKALLCNLSIS